MEITSVKTNKSNLVKLKLICPYKDIYICRASIFSMLIDDYFKSNYCCSDNFDNCPIFLAKLLRG